MKYSTFIESSPEQKTLFGPHELTTGGVFQGACSFLIPVLKYLWPDLPSDKCNLMMVKATDWPAAMSIQLQSVRG